ncbi:hypothetical protein BASA50_009019 [Batrachochytrium salamandrivorans]|uniref:Prefoldin subunit 1 n=1 Tax=Batrachochytrium salamandrivorans TaxID=1357716 RepID=A0ABQ8F2N5_9FUNG|nr:hypothetical protein BASA62_000084 [Batrachochytrium salamandrivorans]KAH6591018.1 hypothetical protein BASA50_009019 [Batrachochytrium salamandrivorans]KAH9277288.1 hypothetical protein BASA83_000155 [Batrachochytrium salamandrivorans]KAJ1343248.1 hypothetical protein BSLG_002274 [Batrachochytrium salamandrivorans]
MSVIPQEAFQKYALEYQTKISETSRQLTTVNSQLQACRHEKRISELTSNELTPLDDTVPTYRSVGRMFVQEDISALKTELDKKSAISAKEISALERAVVTLESELKSSEGTLRDLIKKVTSQ